MPLSELKSVKVAHNQFSIYGYNIHSPGTLVNFPFTSPLFIFIYIIYCVTKSHMVPPIPNFHHAIEVSSQREREPSLYKDFVKFVKPGFKGLSIKVLSLSVNYRYITKA
jgi:hypothetical protein